MGFLLFAARKLQLKRQMNDLQFRNMQLSQEQQTVSKQIANAQQAINAAKNSVNYTTSIFNAANTISQSFQQKNDYAELQKLQESGDQDAVKAYQQQLIQKQNNISLFGSNPMANMANVASNISHVSHWVRTEK